jgi:hypothetical protein
MRQQASPLFPLPKNPPQQADYQNINKKADSAISRVCPKTISS